MEIDFEIYNKDEQSVGIPENTLFNMDGHVFMYKKVKNGIILTRFKDLEVRFIKNKK